MDFKLILDFMTFDDSNEELLTNGRFWTLYYNAIQSNVNYTHLSIFMQKVMHDSELMHRSVSKLNFHQRNANAVLWTVMVGSISHYIQAVRAACLREYLARLNSFLNHTTNQAV